MSSQASSALPAPQLSPSEQLLQLANGYVISSAFYAACKLKIADLLAGGPQPVEQLARQTGTQEDALYRVLRLLASHGIFKEVGLRYFALTPQAEPLRSDAPESNREMLLFKSNPFHHRVYADIMYTLRTGVPAVEKTTGMKCFEYFGHDPEVRAEFNAAMTNFTAGVLPAILEAYDFSGIGTLVDVAGGHGLGLCSILQSYPSMRGILFDLEDVVAEAKAYLEELGVAGRCRRVAGDFFREVPSGGDAYIMQHIIHDWDDDRAAQILRNIRRALGQTPGGKLLVLEAVISDDNQSPFLKFLDVEMLLLPGGRERTEQEFRDLLASAGFTLSRIVPTGTPVISIIEAVPN